MTDEHDVFMLGSIILGMRSKQVASEKGTIRFLGRPRTPIKPPPRRGETDGNGR